jgi:hypothetical protein
MQRVGVIGILLQNLAIKTFGRIELPGLMVRCSLLEYLLDRSMRHTTTVLNELSKGVFMRTA